VSLAFTSNRVLGRRPEPWDAGDYCRLFLDPAVTRWLDPPPAPPPEEQRARDSLARDIDHWEHHGFGPAVLVDSQDGAFLGRGGLNWTTVAGEFAVELPWALLPARWGEGLATEAARAALAWARDLELGEVVSLALIDNHASQRVMQKVGMQRDGEIEHAGLAHVRYRLRFPRPSATTVPFWQDRPYAPRPPLRGEERCEVCVIGGGMGGVATTFHLAERGIRAVLLEAATLAGGASGRNGGFLIAGAAPMYHETCRLWGRERARRVHQATLDGQAAVVELAGEVGAAGALRIAGLLRLAMDAEESSDVLAHHAALGRDGFPGEVLEAPELPPAIRRPGRRALMTPHDGGMDPVQLIRSIADALVRRGARIFESTPAAAPLSVEQDHVVVETPQGRVLAGTVVVALDGQLAGLVPAAGAVRSRRLNACASAPAPRGHLPLPVYARHGTEYVQQLPDGRVVLGGFSDLDGDASWTAEAKVSEPVQARLDRYLREELGVRAPVTHRWAGVVGYAEDPLPRCGPVPGTNGRVYALGGYNGTGNVQSFVAARIVSELITAGASVDADLYAPVGA
jgi:gamma-glutamylputrescine oxidase